MGQARMTAGRDNDTSGGHQILDGVASALAAATDYVQQNILPAYNKAAADYRQLVLNQQGLTETRDTCQKFLEITATFI